MAKFSRHTLVLLFLALTLVPLGCSQQEQKTEVVQPLTDEQVRRWVEEIRSNVNEDLKEMTQSVATSSEVAGYLEKEVERTWRDRVRDGIKYADLFQKYYQNDNYRLIFVTADGLTPQATKLVEIVKKAPEHAINTRLYSLDKIDKLAKKLEKQKSGIPEWSTVVLTPNQVEQMIPWILDHELNLEDPKSRRRVLAAMIGYDIPDDSGLFRKLDTPPLPQVATQADAYLEEVKKQARTIASLELRVADAALRYARDMKHFNLRHFTWKEKQAGGGARIIIYARLETTLNDLNDAKTPEDIERIMRDLEPKHEQYQKLKDALARYEQIKADGGWPRVSRFPISLYSRGPEIATLRKRLEIEGFLGPTPAQLQGEEVPHPTPTEGTDSEITVSPVDTSRFKTHDRDLMDKELLQAVRNYQSTHQFNPRGTGSRPLWNSINVPVERRIKQIRLGLERLRDFAYINEKDYIYVNIPDFHGEAWFNGQRVARFPVVVGNNKRKCNERKEEWEMPNATPVQAANLQYIILNPYWNVPRRIIQEELLPAHERDETFLERKGYELLSDKPGREQIRQKPGPLNALGQVKFIFPNRFNTYMHDTPSKQYFDFPVRAFSHGCVRVQDPIDFADVLLTHLTKKDRAWLDETLKSERTVTVKVEEQIPVFFEYVTVRVDDHGWVNFLADIYRYDQDFFHPPSAESRKCTIAKPVADSVAEDAGEGASAPVAADDVGP